jgi:hypothetical protein
MLCRSSFSFDMPIYAVFSRQWAERTGTKIGLVVDHYNLSLRVSRWSHGVNTIFDAGLELSRKLLPD